MMLFRPVDQFAILSAVPVSLRSKSRDTTPIVSSLTVIAKVSSFVRRSDHTAPPAVGTQRFRSTVAGRDSSGIGDSESAQKIETAMHGGKLDLGFIGPVPHAPGLNFAAQSAPDKLRKAYLLAPGFLSQAGLGLARQAERYGDTALGQFRSGHLPSVLLCHTQCQGRISLLFGPD
jgi:hypothetical protein